jgi:photosystem II stability/assembly factor-like uncharacterized protein
LFYAHKRHRVSMKLKALLGISLLTAASVVPFLPQTATAAPYWTEIRPAGNNVRVWNTSSVSGDGMVGLAGALGEVQTGWGRLFVISSGNQSAEVRPAGNIDRDWASSALNADGSVMLAGNDLELYRSEDTGSTWAEMQPAGNVDRYWAAVDTDGTGQLMLAGAKNGRLYRSINGGDTWAETQPAGNTNQNWASVSVNDDGTMLAGAKSGRLYLSTDSGTSWAETQPAGNVNGDWITSDISSDGQTLLALAGGGYISTNQGSSWSLVTPVDNSVLGGYGGMSSDGQDILIVGYGIFTTSNGGTSWDRTYPTTGTSDAWYSGAMDDSGERLLVGGRRLFVNGTIGAITASTDSDNDGVSNALEDAAPNSGDGNFDGVVDRIQTKVTSFTSSVTNKSVVLVSTSHGCSFHDIKLGAETSNTALDSGFDYPQGILGFEAFCDMGASTTISQYYYGVIDEKYVARKYTPKTHSYANVPDATTHTMTIGGQNVLRLDYPVTDGGIMDDDSYPNGNIVDPVGLGRNAVGVPNTGLGGSFSKR